jgi:hypothetical protein
MIKLFLIVLNVLLISFNLQSTNINTDSIKKKEKIVLFGLYGTFSNSYYAQQNNNFFSTGVTISFKLFQRKIFNIENEITLSEKRLFKRLPIYPYYYFYSNVDIKSISYYCLSFYSIDFPVYTKFELYRLNKQAKFYINLGFQPSFLFICKEKWGDENKTNYIHFNSSFTKIDFSLISKLYYSTVLFKHPVSFGLNAQYGLNEIGKPFTDFYYYFIGNNDIKKRNYKSITLIFSFFLIKTNNKF